MEKEVEDLPSRKSNRMKIMHDYRVLDDLYPELAELADDLEEESIVSSAEEIIYAAFNESGIAPDDPKTVKEAKNSPEWPEWEKAVRTELDQLENMQTWVLVDPPEGRNPVGNK